MPPMTTRARELMPINRKWDLEQLLAAARAFPLRPRERLTFEYVLLDRVNDSVADMRTKSWSWFAASAPRST